MINLLNINIYKDFTNIIMLAFQLDLWSENPQYNC